MSSDRFLATGGQAELSAPRVEFCGVGKRYRRDTPSLRRAISHALGRNGRTPDIWALRDVSLALARGEALGVIGANGAGKSTLLKLVAGITEPSVGRLTVRGVVSPLIEVGAGFHPDLSGRENVFLNGSILGLSRREVARRFDDIVAFAELERFIDVPVKRYSSGMFMRLGFAVAAHVDSEVLLVDEVLAVGDGAFQVKCQRRILDLRAGGKTIVFVSHNLDAVASICDLVLLVEQGRPLALGPPEPVVREYRERLQSRQQDRGDDDDPARRGTGELRIDAVRLLDAAGRECDTFATGHPIRLRLELYAHSRITQPVFVVDLYRDDGLHCCHDSSAHDDFILSAIEGPGAVEVLYPNLALLAGAYQVTAAVYESSALAPYDRRDRVRSFRVLPDRERHGIVRLAHEWRVAPNPPEFDAATPLAPAGTAPRAGAARSPGERP